MALEARTRSLTALFNHLVLPRRLPIREDPDTAEISSSLIARTLAASRRIRDNCHSTGDSQLYKVLNTVSRALFTSSRICNDGVLEQAALLHAFEGLEEDDFIILHIMRQNAGLIVHRQGADVVFHAFEASAQSSEVLRSQKALRWQFPGSTVSISTTTFDDLDFLKHLTSFIARASRESVHQLLATTVKNGQEIGESRDTTHPALISSLLMTLLEAYGSYRSTRTLLKRIRDDIAFESNGTPWRRSPGWLVTRVAIQYYLQNSMGDQVGRVTYKIIIIELLRQFCDDVRLQTAMPPEDLVQLRQKLAGRLVKLKTEQKSFDMPAATAFQQVLYPLQGPCRATLEQINEILLSQWSSFQERTRKRIPRLPPQASPEDCTVPLSNSFEYLGRAAQPLRSRQLPPAANVTTPGAIQSPCSREMDRFIQLAATEGLLRSKALNQSESSCISYSEKIASYQRNVASAYDSFVPGTSQSFLVIMELWRAMDAAILSACPLLADHHIPFPTDIFTVLQVNSKDDMRRVLSIEDYLFKRESNASMPSIFNEPSDNCFAARMFDSSIEIQRIRAQIMEDSKANASRKHDELRQKKNEYNTLDRQYNSSTCMIEDDPDHYGLKVHVQPLGRCERCRVRRKMDSMLINVYEYPLPPSPVAQKVICFELACPSDFAAYRETTWKIVRDWGRKTLRAEGAAFGIFDYNLLSPYVTGTSSNPSLASKVKPISASHYQKVTPSISSEDVCFKGTLDVTYYDVPSKAPVAKDPMLRSLASNFTEALPLSSPLSVLQLTSQYNIGGSGPSSNEIVASQTRCPPSVGATEYLAFQELYSGSSTLWISLLKNLCGAGLNFSAAATNTLVSRVALQVGPRHGKSVQRARHWVFQDPNFVLRLLEQISYRLQAIRKNWREYMCVESLLTITLRMYELIEDDGLLRRVTTQLADFQNILIMWVRALRAEIMFLRGGITQKLRRREIVWACLLARRSHPLTSTHGPPAISSAFIELWIETSIILNENLETSFAGMTVQLRNALIRDWQYFEKFEEDLKQSMLENEDSLSRGISNVWLGADSRVPSFDRWAPVDGWLVSTTLSDETTKAQTVHYGLRYGNLLIDGEQIGKLDEKYRSLTLKQLFGDHPVFVYPSSLLGMRWMVATTVRHHEVHFGFRDGCMITRILSQTTMKLYEIMHPDIFGPRTHCDLPLPLLQGCMHWFDIGHRIIEIRPLTNFWESRMSNWLVDTNTGRAMRRHTCLVNPLSQLFKKATKIFEDFEAPDHILVYQPQGSSSALNVDLQRMGLKFTVNKWGLLYSRELHAEIDPMQDAKTWYGLHSKLVMRNSTTKKIRSVVVPLGMPIIRRDGIHVSVTIVPDQQGNFGLFTINEPLCRIDCAAEPVLIYLRAYIHAITAFIVPDDLTGRTGTEEAISHLRSANALPWQPLNENQRRILDHIASLTPSREYHHLRVKSMPIVKWAENLPTSSQAEEFRPLVAEILRRSEQLNMFHTLSTTITGESEQDSLSPRDLLSKRALLRSSAYTRQRHVNDSGWDPADLEYDTRDLINSNEQQKFVKEIVSYFRDWTSRIVVCSDFSRIVEQWSNLRGFLGVYEDQTISRLLDVDFAHDFTLLAEWSRTKSKADRFELSFLFALLAFGKKVDMECVRALVAFAISEDLKALQSPGWDEYAGFVCGEKPSKLWLKTALQPCRFAFEHEETLRNDPRLTPRQVSRLEQEKQQHESETSHQLAKLVNHLADIHWPNPVLEDVPICVSLISLSKAHELLQLEWQRMAKNYHLSEYLMKVQSIFNKIRRLKSSEILDDYPRDLMPQPPRMEKVFPDLKTLLCTFTIDDGDFQTIFYQVEDFLRQPPNGSNKTQQPSNAAGLTHREDLVNELQSIIDDFARTRSLTRRRYASELQQSLDAFKRQTKKASEPSSDLDVIALSNKYVSGLKALRSNAQAIRTLLESQVGHQWLTLGGLWPSITPTTLLQLLDRQHRSQIKKSSYSTLIAFAILVALTQRLLRLEHATRSHRWQTVQSEMQNPAHTKFDPLERPEWLVLELEADLMIRPEQVEVANATISPASNSLVQLNMGLGKSSVIVPMVAALLSDQLAQVQFRIIVPRSLVPSMAQVLQSRLGGILSRPVTHVPFSRGTPTQHEFLRAFEDLHSSTAKNAGVMLTVAEHLMSFRLSGLQRLVDGRLNEGSVMLKIQEELDEKARDVLDESDFTLAVRCQLVFPSGAQSSVDGSPRRWMTIESIFHLARGLFLNVQKALPKSIEIDQRSARVYPTVYFLRRESEDLLINYLVESLCSGQCGILSIQDYSKEIMESARKLISQPQISSRRLRDLEKFFILRNRPAEWKDLLLLRGLFVHRILIMALRKRHNVTYGLHDSRPLAVPYLARGRPSNHSEWGHPDVSLCLSILSYYYGGLSRTQLRYSLENVLRSDDRAAIFERWLSGSPDTPASLRDCTALNLDDDAQLGELWNLFRYNTISIDHYLNNILFPKHAKVFKQRIQASGWDVPIKAINGSNEESPSQKDPSHRDMVSKSLTRARTTGFSGTNDNRSMLPLTVTQNDLPTLQATNATVLTHLLEDRNRGYVLAAHPSGERYTEYDLLKRITSERIRIVIDAGAQFVEAEPALIVREWLKMEWPNPEPPAAVFYNEKDKAMICDRRGRHAIPLLSSPYADDLSNCLVFLAESQTRGVDLKLPVKAVGALMLGPGLTKDQAVQAAGRLRQLGTTQAIRFFAPVEVHESIQDHRGRDKLTPIDSRDVISWLIEQSCRSIDQLLPLYISQGLSFCNRSQAALDNPNALTDKKQREQFLRSIIQQEDHTLEQLYKPKPRNLLANGPVKYTSPDLISYADELQRRRESYTDTGEAVQAIAMQEVEEEREVAVEIEAIREVDKPAHREPLQHRPVSEDLKKFCADGRVRSRGVLGVSVAEYLQNTAAGRDFTIFSSASRPKVFVTTDFAHTIKPDLRKPNDNYARPVNWILWSNVEEMALVISPHEAEVLLPILRDAEFPKVHLIVYDAPVTRRMKLFDDMTFYIVPHLPGWHAPQWLRRESGILAGRLYFQFEDYIDLCKHIGVKPTIAGAPMHFDGATDEQWQSQLSPKPLQFLQSWITSRRRGQEDFSFTPMGFVCQNKALDASHSFFADEEPDDPERQDSGAAKDLDGTEDDDNKHNIENMDADYDHDLGDDDEDLPWDAEDGVPPVDDGDVEEDDTGDQE